MKKSFMNIGAKMNYNLKELKKRTIRICDMANKDRTKFKNAAINWADFQCVQAAYYIDSCGETGYRVYVGGTSSDNSTAIEYIAEELAKSGYENVEVIFEW